MFRFTQEPSSGSKCQYLAKITDMIKVLFANFMHSSFIKCTVFLYMIRALLCSSSGGLNCIYASSGS